MNVLLIEDNEGDQVILKEAFKEAKVTCKVNIVSDGAQAIDYLNRDAGFQNSERPCLILLDLNLPKKNGVEVLQEIKKNKNLSHIPVIIFSNSNSPKDICDCYSSGASAYICKPAHFQELVQFAQAIKSFWLKQVRFCPHDN